MKKTIITVISLLAAGAACAESYTTSLTTAGTSNLSTKQIFAWTLCLNDSFLTTRDEEQNSITLSTSDSLSLTDISVFCGGGNYTGDYYLAIYEGTSTMSGSWTNPTNNSVTGSIGDFVGVSTNDASRSSNGTMSFSFSDVTLTAGQAYTFAFVKTNATTTLDVEGDDARRNALIEHSARAYIATYSTSDNTDNGYYGSWNSALSSGWVGGATYTYSPIAAPIPEPATATLSLLALAGLTARRRRK